MARKKVLREWNDENAFWFHFDNNVIAYAVKRVVGRDYYEVVQELRGLLEAQKNRYQNEIQQTSIQP